MIQIADLAGREQPFVFGPERKVSVIVGSIYEAVSGTDRVRYTCQLHAAGTSGTTQDRSGQARRGLIQLERVLKKADDFKAKRDNSPLYAYFRAPNENTRRAFIHSWSLTPIDDDILTTDLSNGAANYLLILELQYGYEVGSFVGTNYQDVSVFGGIKYLPYAMLGNGTLPSRIERFRIGPSQSTSYTFDKVWVGFKSMDRGYFPFNPEIPASAATGRTQSGARIWQSANTRKGSCVRIDFNDEQRIVQRVVFPLQEWSHSASQYSPYYRGDYRLLCTYSFKDPNAGGVGKTAVVTVRPRYGHAGRLHVGSAVDIRGEGHANWHTAEIGTVTIPENPFHFVIALDVGLVDGDPEDDRFFIDSLWIIPAEYGCVVDGSKLSISADYSLNIETKPDFSVEAYTMRSLFQESTTLFSMSVRPDLRLAPLAYGSVTSGGTWRMPTRGAMMTIAADRTSDDGQSWSDKADVYISIVNRFRHYATNATSGGSL